ncbi:HAF repeat-containing PEP-CTERM protein [Massilia sp. CCM 8734]|uniref:HAF repeat-containing PEP-CTERM protein n=1 Tax=Massilia sp. CCM 8734 TaxID=2609283 RepID=UPI00141EBE31|nr:HAF repeat-containing PEP-CTERM protein [Massilia sp. CCM 8734]NHZ96743.1 PEP-CTERM sorting domain-containing protein [Massilia sp. CCM 8734]
MQKSSVLFVASLLIAAAGPAQALQYKLSPLLVDSASATEAFSINNAGTVLGLAQRNQAQAVLWEQGTARYLSHDPQSYGSYGLALNHAGDVAGYNFYPHGILAATRWTAAGIESVPVSNDYSQATDINAHGVTVANGLGGYVETSVSWDGVTTTKLLPFSTVYNDVPPGWPFSPGTTAQALNDLGQVVGWGATADHKQHAALWNNGQIVDLHGGGTGSAAKDINNAGQIVINTYFGEDVRAGLWQNGALSYLGEHSEGNGMNALGAVVGWAGVGEGAQHAVLWQDGMEFDLNAQIVGERFGFTYLEKAYGINDHGQIVGRGLTADGSHQAFLLSPVPEPGAWLMLAVGLGIVVRVKRRVRAA